MMSSSRITRNSSPSILTVWPEYLPKVADLDIHRDELAGIVALARTDGNHFALIGLFAGRIGKNDAAGSGALGFETLDNHAVMQRTNLHFSNSKQFLNNVLLPALSKRASCRHHEKRITAPNDDDDHDGADKT